MRYSFDIYGGAVRKLQEDDYYAFGLRHSVTGGTNNYLYNGKELQDELGQYDYGARFYDPVVGRFTTVDPVAEYFPWMTSYQYASNDPIRNIDLDGLEGIPFNFFFGNNSAVPKLGPFIETTSKYTVENIAKAGGEFTNKTVEAIKRGNAAEAEQLANRGLEKNTKPETTTDPKTGREGTTIPDSYTKEGGTVEVKNVGRQALTKQLRLQEKISNDKGLNPELIINTDAQLTKPVLNRLLRLRPINKVHLYP